MDTKFSDMAQLAEKLVLFEENPLYWGDENMYASSEGLSGPKDWDIPFQVWEWAEQNHRDEIKPQIARAVARATSPNIRRQGQIIRHVPQKPNFWNRLFHTKVRYKAIVEEIDPLPPQSDLFSPATWLKKFEAEASQALERGDLESYAGFLEGMWALDTTSTGKLENILLFYRILKKKEKVAYYLGCRIRGKGRMPFLASHKYKNMIWRTWIEAYYLSKEANYPKGIFFAVLGLGEYLDGIGASYLAAKFFYHAQSLINRKIKTAWGITVRDRLRQLVDTESMREEVYAKKFNTDELITQFLVFCNPHQHEEL
jgi:hypothetical protein